MPALDSPRLWLTIIILVGAGYGGWIFYDQIQSQSPDWQNDHTQSKKFPPHRVNLWSEPNPPSTGEIKFSVEFDYVNLMNEKAGTVNLILKRKDSQIRKTKQARFYDSGPYGGRYSTGFSVSEPGKWTLVVEATMEGDKTRSQFSLNLKK